MEDHKKDASTFAINDLLEQNIRFRLDVDGQMFFHSDQDFKKAKERSKEMGYYQWLFH